MKRILIIYVWVASVVILRGGDHSRWTNASGMVFAEIPQGMAELGSPAEEEGRGKDEYLRQIRIEKPFFLGITEVTQQQWELVMKSNPSKHKGALLPVEMVTFQEAVEFCEKLGRTDGRRYRLPTGGNGVASKSLTIVLLFSSTPRPHRIETIQLSTS